MITTENKTLRYTVEKGEERIKIHYKTHHTIFYFKSTFLDFALWLSYKDNHLIIYQPHYCQFVLSATFYDFNNRNRRILIIHYKHLGMAYGAVCGVPF